MANVNLLVANPTAADVTVGSLVANARSVTALTLDDTSNDAFDFLAADCALISVSSEASLSNRCATAFLLERLQHRQ